MSDSDKPRPPSGLPAFGSPPSGTEPLGPPPPLDEVPVYDRGTPGGGRRTVVLAAVVALLVGLGGGFFAGRQTAPKGPATLADAVRLASQGKLPTGSFNRGQGGLGGLFRGNGGQGGPFGGQNGNGQNGGNQSGNGQGAQGRQFSRSIQATVGSVAGDVVTLQTAAGQVQVHIGPSTVIQKVTKGSKADLAPGNRVVVTFDLSGSRSDGSVTAASILSEGTAS